MKKPIFSIPPKILNGTGDPSSALNDGTVIGDYYLDDATGNYWQRETYTGTANATTIVLAGNVQWKRVAVLKGAQGSPGAAGTPGTKILIGNSGPFIGLTAQTSVGDNYLNSIDGKWWQRFQLGSVPLDGEYVTFTGNVVWKVVARLIANSERIVIDVTDDLNSKLQVSSINLSTLGFALKAGGVNRLSFPSSGDALYRTLSQRNHIFVFDTKELLAIGNSIGKTQLILRKDTKEIELAFDTEIGVPASDAARSFTLRRDTDGRIFRLFDWNGATYFNWLSFNTNNNKASIAETFRVDRNNRTIELPMKSTAEINAIPAGELVAGQTCYNTTLNTICFYNGTSWQKVTSTAM